MSEYTQNLESLSRVCLHLAPFSEISCFFKLLPELIALAFEVDTVELVFAEYHLKF